MKKDTAIYIGYNLETMTFRDEHNNEIPESKVKELYDAGQLDATMMVMRLIRMDWDHEALAEFYEEN